MEITKDSFLCKAIVIPYKLYGFNFTAIHYGPEFMGLQ